MFESLRLSDGVLQRGWKEPGTTAFQWQVVVPKALCDVVLQAVRGTPGSGHFSVGKTLHRLHQGFYWSQQRRDVVDFCRQCDECTARKGLPDRPRAQLQQFPVGSPMEKVEIDVLGRFPLSERDNRYSSLPSPPHAGKRDPHSS